MVCVWEYPYIWRKEWEHGYQALANANHDSGYLKWKRKEVFTLDTCWSIASMLNARIQSVQYMVSGNGLTSISFVLSHFYSCSGRLLYTSLYLLVELYLVSEWVPRLFILTSAYFCLLFLYTYWSSICNNDRISAGNSFLLLSFIKNICI